MSEWSRGNSPVLIAIGRGIQAPTERVFVPRNIKTIGELCAVDSAPHDHIKCGAHWRDHATTSTRQGPPVESCRHVNRVGPIGGTTVPRQDGWTHWWDPPVETHLWDHDATSTTKDQQLPPWCHVMPVGPTVANNL